MSVAYSLKLDDEYDYHLIGIHTSMKDYGLAYRLNKDLRIGLKRAGTDLDIINKITGEKAFFALYEYHDGKADVLWNLIANKYKYSVSVNELLGGTLFNKKEHRIITTGYLIPEKTEIDFFIKITGTLTNNQIDHIVRDAKHLRQVTATYKICPESLKSKKNLIF